MGPPPFEIWRLVPLVSALTRSLTRLVTSLFSGAERPPSFGEIRNSKVASAKFRSRIRRIDADNQDGIQLGPISCSVLRELKKHFYTERVCTCGSLVEINCCDIFEEWLDIIVT